MQREFERSRLLQYGPCMSILGANFPVTHSWCLPWIPQPPSFVKLWAQAAFGPLPTDMP